jgi:hypothetical protein
MSFPFKQPQPWKQFLGSNPNDMSEMLNVVYQIDIQIDDKATALICLKEVLKPIPRMMEAVRVCEQRFSAKDPETCWKEIARMIRTGRIQRLEEEITKGRKQFEFLLDGAIGRMEADQRRVWKKRRVESEMKGVPIDLTELGDDIFTTIKDGIERKEQELQSHMIAKAQDVFKPDEIQKAKDQVTAAERVKPEMEQRHDFDPDLPLEPSGEVIIKTESAETFMLSWEDCLVRILMRLVDVGTKTRASVTIGSICMRRLAACGQKIKSELTSQDDLLLAATIVKNEVKLNDWQLNLFKKDILFKELSDNFARIAFETFENSISDSFKMNFLTINADENPGYALDQVITLLQGKKKISFGTTARKTVAVCDEVVLPARGKVRADTRLKKRTVVESKQSQVFEERIPVDQEEERVPRDPESLSDEEDTPKAPEPPTETKTAAPKPAVVKGKKKAVNALIGEDSSEDLSAIVAAAVSQALSNQASGWSQNEPPRNYGPLHPSRYNNFYDDGEQRRANRNDQQWDREPRYGTFRPNNRYEQWDREPRYGAFRPNNRRDFSGDRGFRNYNQRNNYNRGGFPRNRGGYRDDGPGRGRDQAQNSDLQSGFNSNFQASPPNFQGNVPQTPMAPPFPTPAIPFPPLPDPPFPQQADMRDSGASFGQRSGFTPKRRAPEVNAVNSGRFCRYSVCFNPDCIDDHRPGQYQPNRAMLDRRMQFRAANLCMNNHDRGCLRSPCDRKHGKSSGAGMLCESVGKGLCSQFFSEAGCPKNHAS